MSEPAQNIDRVSRLRSWSLAAAAAGLAVSVLIAIVRPEAFWPGYLVAASFALGLPLGALAVSLLHQLTGGRWGFAVLRELAAAVGTIPWMCLVIVPLMIAPQHLYGWLDAASDTAAGAHDVGAAEAPAESRADQSLNAHQAQYFRPELWLGRAAVYAVLWIALAALVRIGYRELCDEQAEAAWHRRPRRAAVGLLVNWLAITFAAFDGLMSLEPHWVSTIFGSVIAMGFVIGGWSFVITMRHLLSSPLEPSRVTHDLGNFLLAFLMVWAYFGFSQYLIIWSGDLPHETSWYLRRMHGTWGMLGSLLLLLHFAAPFLLLLSRPLKKSSLSLTRIAAGLLVMHFAELVWTVLPAFGPPAFVSMASAAASTVLLGGAGLWLFLGQWSAIPGVPMHLLESPPAEAALTSPPMEAQA